MAEILLPLTGLLVTGVLVTKIFRRRQIWKLMILLLCTIFATLCGVIIIFRNDLLSLLKLLPPSKLSVEHITIPVQGLSEPLQVVQLSDLHFRENMDKNTVNHLWEAIDTSNSLHPDLVVITGDLIDESPSPAVLQGLSNLFGKLETKQGVFISLGNHDYWKGGHAQANEIREALTSPTINVLINDSRRIVATNGTSTALAIVGLGDIWGKDFIPEKVLPSIPISLPRLVLSHNPDTAAHLSKYRADVILSGHTHAGQICLPSFKKNRGIPLLRILKYVSRFLPDFIAKWIPGRGVFNVVYHWEWAQGLHAVPRTLSDTELQGSKDNYLYVNRGMADIYRRVFCQPELTFINLVPKI